jgi:hypothetical protein
LPITKDSFNSILQMRLFWVPRCLMDWFHLQVAR